VVFHRAEAHGAIGGVFFRDSQSVALGWYEAAFPAGEVARKNIAIHYIPTTSSGQGRALACISRFFFPSCSSCCLLDRQQPEASPAELGVVGIDFIDAAAPAPGRQVGIDDIDALGPEAFQAVQDHGLFGDLHAFQLYLPDVCRRSRPPLRAGLDVDDLCAGNPMRVPGGELKRTHLSDRGEQGTERLPRDIDGMYTMMYGLWYEKYHFHG
jgi:hypothetical protein